MSQMPAARLGDDVAHSQAGLGMLLGVLGGVVAGAVLVGATIATGGAALAVVAAVGGAAGLTSFGGLAGMNIGAAMMGPPTGKFVVGSPNVLINSRPATMTFVSMAVCIKEAGVPIPLATGSSTVFINIGMAGREGEKLGCSAVSVKMTSPNVLIGGESAQDPRVEIKPEVPEWAVTALQVLGVAGAILALPFAIATVGVAATIGGAVLGYYGGKYGGEAGRALGEALGMSEAGKRAMEAGGQFLGGMIGGAAGVKGVRAFNSRYQVVVHPNRLGSNLGNVSVMRRPPNVRNPNGTINMTRASKQYAKVVNSNKPWKWRESFQGKITNAERAQIKQGAIDRGLISKVEHKPGTRYADFQKAGLVKKVDNLPQNLWKSSDAKQFSYLDSRIPGGRPAGTTWHHTETPGRMELVPFGPHNTISHIGGRSPGHWAHGPR